MFNNEKEKEPKIGEYVEVLDKMIELEKGNRKENPVKITICIVGGIGCVMFTALLCNGIRKSDFSMDSILSTLLAFFSIFISIFFYFKADETSINFYKSSYEFMKEVSVTLGKIEERFGEKLNHLDDKINHLDNVSFNKSAQIQNEKESKDKIIEELMRKAHLGEEEQKKIIKEIEEKDAIIEQLKREQSQAQMEAIRLRARMRRREIENEWEPSVDFLIKLFNEDIKEISGPIYDQLQKMGCIEYDGTINKTQVSKRINDIKQREKYKM